LDIPYSSLTYF
jgi:hypothetical protein